MADFAINVSKNVETKVLARKALKHLLKRANTPPHLFQRNHSMIRVAEDGLGDLKMEELRLPQLKSEFAEVGGFFRTAGNGEKRYPKYQDLPDHIQSHILNTPLLWEGVPKLVGVATSPFFTGDGRLVSKPGYDESTGYLFSPPAGFDMREVSAAPKKKEIRQAVGLIGEAFHDFPFVNDASRAHAMAAMIQPFARALLNGPTPTYFFCAANPKDGKTLLGKTAMFPAHGEIGVTSWPSREEEIKKHLTSIMIEAQPTAFFDNVSGPIKSDSYSALMTADFWTDRILGGSITGRWQITATFMMSGINPKAKDEMIRRMAFCELDGRGVPEEQRQASFLHKGQMKWLAQNRWTLAWACCTLVQAWLVADRPPPVQGTPKIGSYEAWRRVLGGILTHAGVEGFLQNLGRSIAKDDRTADLEMLLQCAWERYEREKWRVADVVKNLMEDTEPDEAGSQNPFLEFQPDSGRSLAKPLGKALEDGMILGGFRVRRTANRSGGFHHYWLELVGDA